MPILILPPRNAPDAGAVIPVLARATCRTDSIAPDDARWVRRQYTVTG